jgi:hypothetical protein
LIFHSVDDHRLRSRTVGNGDGETMSLKRHRKLVLKSLTVVYLLTGAPLLSGCGSHGAGTVHIDSPQARRKVMQTGAGLGPVMSAKTSPSATAGKPISRPTSQTSLAKKH